MLIEDITRKKSPLSQLERVYTLKAELDAILQENQRLRAEHQQLSIKILSLEEEVSRLKEQLKLAQQRRFGKKSEVGETSANSNENAISKTQSVQGYTRKQGKKTCGRSIDTSLLPHFCIHHDLKEEDKICKGCNNPLHFISTETTGQLELLPQRFYIAEHIRYKYGCRRCQTIKMGYKAKAAIAKALAGNSVLTEIIVNKYQYHLPLYRQSKMMSNYNIVIPDNTLGKWVMQVGEGLLKLYEALWEVVLANGYLQVDETPVKLLKPDKQGYLWSYYAPWVGQGLIVFEISLTRSANVAEKRLAYFKGLLQTDGYSGYQGLRKREGIEGLGCITHSRRKFSEIYKLTKNPNGIAALAIEKLKPLYALEERMRTQGYTFYTRKRLRQKIAWPILKDFHAWLKKNLVSVPPKSQLANAISYTLNQWCYLIKYVRHGMAEIDTNWVEDEIRAIALGKKNWLFMGHEESGKIHALFYSLRECLNNCVYHRICR